MSVVPPRRQPGMAPGVHADIIVTLAVEMDGGDRVGLPQAGTT